MPQNEDDYETDGKEKMCSTHKRIEYVVRCVLLLLFFSLSEKKANNRHNNTFIRFYF